MTKENVAKHKDTISKQTTDLKATDEKLKALKTIIEELSEEKKQLNIVIDSLQKKIETLTIKNKQL